MTSRAPLSDAPRADAASAPANPFGGDLAIRNSRYFGVRGGRACPLSDADAAPDLFASAVVGAFRGFVLNPEFPCLGARSAVTNETCRVGVYDDLGAAGPTAGLGRDLYRFAREVEAAGDDPDDPFRTFVAVFRGPSGGDERDFEDLLWGQLRRLNEIDSPLHDWSSRVSSDPESPHFGFSFAGSAFFIVGLHPHASRSARRFPWPTLVFNPHTQFQRLKDAGGWGKFQRAIRVRDSKLQGSLNPNLADHGTVTEARQYSGRAVEADWHPPFAAQASIAAGGPASACPFLNAMADRGAQP